MEKNIKKMKNQINDLVNDPNFIRLGELLAERRRLVEKKEKDEMNLLKKLKIKY